MLKVAIRKFKILEYFSYMDNLKKITKKYELEIIEVLRGRPIGTIFKVNYKSNPAILKIYSEEKKEFEKNSYWYLKKLGGFGAVNIYQGSASFILMEYLSNLSLITLSEIGLDDLATNIICGVLKKIHTVNMNELPSSIPTIEKHFSSLFIRSKKDTNNKFFRLGAEYADYLLNKQSNISIIHGDIHHGNILKSEKRGWVSIDPQCLLGSKEYDYGNIFYNPNLSSNYLGSKKRINRCANIISKNNLLDKKLILEFAYIHGCLSSSWHLDNGEDPHKRIKIANSIKNIIDNL